MCLAIYSPRGAQVKKRWLRNGFLHNSDGAGFAIAEAGRVKIYKGFMTWKEFWTAYEPHQSKAVLVHFRWATHGKTDAPNTHPFYMCGNDYAVVHNGVLNIKCHEADMSDTWHFVGLVMEPMVKACALDEPALKYLVEEAIGSFNKIAVMRHDGKVVIFNEDQGSWCNGSWFSNSNFKSPPTWHGGYDDYFTHGHSGYRSGVTVKQYPPAQVKEIEAELLEEEGETDRRLTVVPDYEPRRSFISQEAMDNQSLMEA